jgi:putative nucleotidyltransferase with HDIG domain
MELRDPYTAGHQARVAAISCAIAKELGWNEDRIKGLQMAGLIHDIGKIGIPSEILSKPSQLSEFEEKLMEEHAEHSFQLLKGIDFPWPIAEMVHQHHERMDGSGYPHGLKGDEIMLEGRVLAVADTIEAMSTHRPYRPALGLPAAIQEIKARSGIQLDAQVVNAALHLFEGKPSLDGLV